MSVEPKDRSAVSSEKRPSNWLENTSRSLQSRFPVLGSGSEYVTSRLSALLLERLPPGVAEPLFSLLPQSTVVRSRALQLSAQSQEDASIGYPDFVQHAENALGTLGLMNGTPLCENVTNVFLWAIVQDIPADLKNRMSLALPLELSSRMNLYSAMADGSKVA